MDIDLTRRQVETLNVAFMSVVVGLMVGRMFPTKVDSFTLVFLVASIACNVFMVSKSYSHNAASK